MLLLQKLCEFFWEQSQSKAMLPAIYLKVLLKATSANCFIILLTQTLGTEMWVLFSKLLIFDFSCMLNVDSQELSL